MKLKHYLLALMAVAGLTVGCQKESGDQGEASMKLSVSELSFPASTEDVQELTKTVEVRCNREWKVVEDLSTIDWIRVTANGEDINGKKFPASDAPVVVSVSVYPNEDYERSTTLTFNGGTNAKATLKINQEGYVEFDELADIIAEFKKCQQDTLHIEEATVVKCYVVSNQDLDNLTSLKSMYVQDESAGINIFCNANHSQKFGDLVQIDLKGAAVTKFAGAPEIVNIDLDKFKTISSGNEVEPEEIAYADLTTGIYEGAYVTLNEDVQVAGADTNKTWLVDSKATSITVETRTGDSFIIRSGKNSKYGSEAVPKGSGRIAGICTTYNGTAQLIFAQDSDRAGLTGKRFSKEESDMVIDPAKLELPATGDLSESVSVTCSRDWSVVGSLPEWLTVTVDGESVEGKTFKGSSDPVEMVVTATVNEGQGRACSLSLSDNTSTKNTLSVSQEGTVGYDSLKDILDAFIAGGRKDMTITGKTVKVSVVSNQEFGNLTSNKIMYVQDETAGINVFCSANHTFKFGDELVISLDGTTVKDFNGAPEIDGLAIASCTVASTGNDVDPVEIDFADIASGQYEACYVKFKDVQVADSDLSKTWVVSSAHTSINMVTKTGATFVVRSGKYSTFGSETVPQGSGSIAGIVSTYSGTTQIIFARNSDRADMTGERFKIQTETLSIAEVIAAKNGTGVTEGRVICLGPRGFIMNDGNDQNLYVYTKTAPAFAVGDIVKVTGTFKEYGNVVEYSEPTVEAGTATIPESPEADPTALSDEDIAAYVGDKSSKYVSFKGNLKVSGNYINVILATTEAFQGSIESTQDVSAFDGMDVEVVGYFIGLASSKYFTIVLDEINVSGDPYLKISPSSSVEVASSATSQEIKVFSNMAWTVESDNADFVPDVLSGQDNGTITVSFPANTDPDNAKVANITVSAGTEECVLTITQKKYTDPGKAKFVKVTSAPTDWSGTYIAVFNKDKKHCLFNGSLTADTAGNYVDIDEPGAEITATDELLAKTITLSKMTNGYSVKVAGGKYIYGTNEKNVMNFTDTPTAVSVSYAEGVVTLSSGEKSNFQMYFTSDAAQQRIRFYKSNQVKPVLYKLVEE